MTARTPGPMPLLVGALLLASSCHSGPSTVRIGLAVSLDDAGVLPMRLGAELAAKEINDSGGIDGRRLELVVENDFGDPDSSVALATRLYDSDVSAVIGGAYSGVTLAAAPVYNGGRRPLVQLSPSASSPLVSGAGDYTFRLCPSDLAYGAALAHFARDRGLNRAAVLYVNDEYGRGVRRTFATEYVRLGGELIEVDPFLPGAADIGAYLVRLARQRRVDLLVLAANQDEGLAVLRQLKAAGNRLPVVAADGMVGAERVAPALMEGVYVSSAYIESDPREENRRFVAAYREAYPEAGLPDQGAASSYDAVRLLAGAAKGTQDRSQLRDRLAGVGGTESPFEGVVGPLGFDSLGDVPTLAVRVGVVRRGELILADQGVGQP